MKKVLYILLFLLVFSFDAKSQKRLMKLAEKDQQEFSIKDLLSLNRINEFAVSPDGKTIVYSMQNIDLAKNKKYTSLYTVSIDGKENKRITEGNFNDYNPVWMPDGKTIVFLSNRMNDPQIYTIDFPVTLNTRPKAISTIEGGVSNLKISPNGKFYSFSKEVKVKDALTDKYPDMRQANVRIYSDLPVRHWDHWEGSTVNHICLMPVGASRERDLMKDDIYGSPVPPFGDQTEYDWSPDSKEIAFTSKREKDQELSTNTDIYTINIETNEVKNITKGRPGYDKNPLYSPDGKYIAFNAQERAGFEADKVKLMIFDRSSNSIEEVSKKLDQWCSNLVWSPDSKFIYCSATTEGKNPLYQFDLDGKFTRLTNGNFADEFGLDITPDGKTLVFGRTSFMTPVDLYTVSTSGGDGSRITTVNDIILSRSKDITVTEKWLTTKDGKKMHTWVLLPPNFDANKKYPMITYCQGGPQSQVDPGWSYRWNMYLMASKGYVVVAPNRRGLPGFGQDWNDAISKDWGGLAMQDLLVATDSISEMPYIDKKRRAAVGASAGGYAVFWLAGNHENRFSAFIAHCGVFNAESMYGSTEELFFTNWEFGGPYWDPKNAEIYAKSSPHRFAQNWNTPIMIITGENDFRVPYTQSLEAFTVAQSKGIPSKLLSFPEENHWVKGNQNSYIWHSEFYEWLDKYLKK